MKTSHSKAPICSKTLALLYLDFPKEILLSSGGSEEISLEVNHLIPDKAL